MPGNWFVALPVTMEAPAALRDAPPDVRLFAPADWHLTVAFLGPVGAVRAARAFDAAQCFQLSVRDITLNRVVALGPPRRPSAFSALLDQGRAEVEYALGEARDAVFDAADVPRDKRPPLAHLTLARPRRSATLEARKAGQAWAEQLDVFGYAAQLSKIALYTWSDDRLERQFRIERERALR